MMHRMTVPWDKSDVRIPFAVNICPANGVKSEEDQNPNRDGEEEESDFPEGKIG